MQGKLTCYGLGACRTGGAHAASMLRGLADSRQGLHTQDEVTAALPSFH